MFIHGNIECRWYKKLGLIIWILVRLHYYLDISEHSDEGPLHILIFEIFYLIFKETKVRAYTTEVKAL